MLARCDSGLTPGRHAVMSSNTVFPAVLYSEPTVAVYLQLGTQLAKRKQLNLTKRKSVTAHRVGV